MTKSKKIFDQKNFHQNFFLDVLDDFKQKKMKKKIENFSKSTNFFEEKKKLKKKRKFFKSKNFFNQKKFFFLLKIV